VTHPYKHIAVKPETKEQLDEVKPEGVTWDRWMRQQLLTDD